MYEKCKQNTGNQAVRKESSTEDQKQKWRLAPSKSRENVLEKSLLHAFHNTFLSKDAEEGTISPLNQDNKYDFQFKFALYVWDLNSRFHT